MKIRIEKKNGESVFKTITPRTRLKFSIGVITVNFVLGVVGMLLGADLTALGVFLAMANMPLYTYVLGESFSPTKIPDSYYNQAHSGSGGLSGLLNQTHEQSPNTPTPSVTETPQQKPPTSSVTETPQQKPDEFNNPNYPQNNNPLPIVQKPDSELG